jgi:hypothetical protein
MIKKITVFFVFLLLASCNSSVSKEMEKTARARSASERINSGNINSNDALKELDE